MPTPTVLPDLPDRGTRGPAGTPARALPARTASALALAALAVLVGPAAALAHGPATTIGRAVEAFGSVSVSYEPGSAVSDVEAGGFPTIVDSNPKVAFMPASASSEISGGPDAMAEEIAREARVSGTVVVLIGTQLGAWSSDIGADRLSELVREASSGEASGSPAATVEALVRSVQAESTDKTPWVWIAAVIAVVGGATLLVLALVARRRSA